MADTGQEQYSILVNMLDNSDYDFSHIDDIDELKIYEEKGENILDDNNNQLRVAKLDKKNNEIDRLKEREAKIGHLLQEIRKYINFHGSEPEPLPSPQPSPPRLVRRRRSPAHRSRSPSRIHRTPASRSRSPVRRSRSPVRRISGSPTFRSPTRRRNNNNPASGGKKNRTKRKRSNSKRSNSKRSNSKRKHTKRR